MSKAENALVGTFVAASFGIIGLLIVFMVLGPVFTRWSLNYLFHTEIPADWYSYWSIMWLHGVVAARYGASKT